MILARLALRELLNNRRFSVFFVLNLVLGLSGFLTLDAFKTSVAAGLRERSRQILTADLAVSSRRPFTDEELRLLRERAGPAAEETRLLETYSMVASTATSRLAEVMVIEEGYPFYGALRLRGTGEVASRDPKPILGRPLAWIHADLAAQLRVAPGGRVKIAEKTFTIADLVTEDAGASGRGFSLASRIFIGRPQLDGTGLIQKGSTVHYRHFFRLPPGDDAEARAREINRALPDPAIRVVTHQRASQTVGRLQGFLNDYLGLAALASLFLSAVGGAYLFRGFVTARLKELAVLRSLGLTPGAAQRLFVLQLAMLGAAGGAAATGLSWILLPGLMRLLSTFLAYPVSPALSPVSIAWALAIGVAGSLLTCAPVLTRVRPLQPSALFQEAGALALEGRRWAAAVAALPGLLFYWALSVWQAKSYFTGSLFVALFLGSGAALGLLAAFGLSVMTRAFDGAAIGWRLAVRQLARARFASVSCFLALGLGVLLINVIPQIQMSLEQEVRSPGVSEIPSLFLFDIQPEQEAPLRRFLEARGQGLNFLTPLIRGRLERVNGAAFRKDMAETGMATREEESQSRFRNRGFNLTYRARLTESERLVAGRPFSASVPEVPEISVERRFAKRLGLKLGDVLSFDVQGVPVEGKIVSLRAVEWTSFQPNFFVQFQPGVLEEAPKTFLASVPALPFQARLDLQDALVARFPTVSIIDVSQVVERLLGIFRQMAWAIRWMAVLALVAGMLVLFSIANHEAHARRQEANLLKVLGAPLSEVRRLFRREFGLLALSAGLLGTALSIGMSYLLSRVLFENTWVFAWKTPLAVVAGTTLLALLTVDRATARVLRQSPAALLQSDAG